MFNNSWFSSDVILLEVINKIFNHYLHLLIMPTGVWIASKILLADVNK